MKNSTSFKKVIFLVLMLPFGSAFGSSEESTKDDVNYYVRAEVSADNDNALTKAQEDYIKSATIDESLRAAKRKEQYRGQRQSWNVDKETFSIDCRNGWYTEVPNKKVYYDDMAQEVSLKTRTCRGVVWIFVDGAHRN